MKACFSAQWRSTTYERKRKREWLSKFQQEGYQLIDAVKVPIDGSSQQRAGRIKEDVEKLISEIKRINPERIILIKVTVYKALAKKLVEEGFAVMNQEPLPFPSSGRQAEFHRKFDRKWLV